MAMLRTLMLTPDIGILDRRIAQEAATLARLGSTVDIYPIFDPLDGADGRLAEGVRLLGPTEAPPTSGVRRYRMGRRLKRRLRSAAPWLHQALHVAQTLLLDTAVLSTTEAEAALMAGDRYDLVIAHDTPMLPLAKRLGRSWKAAVICDLHEIYPEQHHIRDEWWTYRSFKRLDARYLPLADGIICVNPAIQEYVERSARVTAPIGVVYNSVPYVRDPGAGPRVNDVFEIDASKRVLVFAGSLRQDANLDHLIRSFARAHVHGWALAILGSGPEEAALRRTVIDLDVSDRVFLGRRVPQDDLVSVLASANAGILPYVGVDYNHVIATPNKLFEYIQARLPIGYSSELPQVRQILDEVGIGTSLDLSTESSFADGLRRFLEHRVTEVSSLVLEVAAQKICWERDEEVLVAIVDAALAASGTHPLLLAP